MDIDKIKLVEDQILADDELIVMDHDTADALVTIAESVLICEILTDDGELLTAEIQQPTGSSWDELDKLLSAMHVIRWQCCDDNEYNMTKYGERVTKIQQMSARYPHLIRMYDELTELKGKWSKLIEYYDKYRSELDAKQQDLMMFQRAIMEEYIGVLDARIKHDTELYNK